MRVSVIDKDIRGSLIHHNSEILCENIITKIHLSVYETKQWSVWILRALLENYSKMPYKIMYKILRFLSIPNLSLLHPFTFVLFGVIWIEDFIQCGHCLTLLGKEAAIPTDV